MQTACDHLSLPLIRISQPPVSAHAPHSIRAGPPPECQSTAMTTNVHGQPPPPPFFQSTRSCPDSQASDTLRFAARLSYSGPPSISRCKTVNELSRFHKQWMWSKPCRKSIRVSFSRGMRFFHFLVVPWSHEKFTIHFSQDVWISRSKVWHFIVLLGVNSPLCCVRGWGGGECIVLVHWF
jgi:hypothetical protein